MNLLQSCESSEVERPMPRTILVHLNVEVPDNDPRDAAEIANAIMGALEVGSDDTSCERFTVTVPLAEEV